MTSIMNNLIYECWKSVKVLDEKHFATLVFAKKSENNEELMSNLTFYDVAYVEEKANRLNISCLNISDSTIMLRMNSSDFLAMDVASNENANVPRISTEVPIWVIPCYCIILLFAIVGNCLVISTLIQNRRMRTITNVFLLNLAVSDMLLGVLCMPVTLVGTLLRHFIFGEILCKLIQFAQASSVAVSSWTLVAISCERYYAICHPLRSRTWQTINHAYKIIGFIWVGSMVCMMPIAIFSQLIATSRQGLRKCRDQWPSYEYERFYNIFLDIMLLVLPLIILCVAYILITRTLYVGIQQERIMTLTLGEMPTGAGQICDSETVESHQPFDVKRLSSYRLSMPFKKKHNNENIFINEFATKKDDLTNDNGQKTEDKVQHKPEAHIFTERQHFESNNVMHGSRAKYSKCVKNTSNIYCLRSGTTKTSEYHDFAKDNRKSDKENVAKETRVEICQAQTVENQIFNRTSSLHSAVSALRRSNEAKNLESKKRVVKMLFVLVLEFFICWTPLYVINTVAMFIGPRFYEYVDYTAIIFLQLLAYSSSCCNPITYCFMNASFRRSFVQTFKGFRLERANNRFWNKQHDIGNNTALFVANNSIAIPNSVTVVCTESPQL